MSTRDWHVLCVPPIDRFEGMTPLTSYVFPATAAGALADPYDAEYLIGERKERLEWAGGALDALRRAGSKVHWDGDFRHEPYVGALLWGSDGALYLVAKQENNGTCFIVSQGFAVPLPPTETIFFSTVVRESRAEAADLRF
ncbi:hypothetical protein AB0J57_32455 [Streptomyces sp. NPDC049837]|uniref:hypothetical protein n=1 Tax=Streptomyces sp. NPDC049837 TaxID=3155277 RepID=UPI00343838B0